MAREEPSAIRALHLSIAEVDYHRHRIDAISEDLVALSARRSTEQSLPLLTRNEHVPAWSLYEEATRQFDQALLLEPEARRWMLLDDADDRLTRVYIARGRAMFHRGLWMKP